MVLVQGVEGDTLGCLPGFGAISHITKERYKRKGIEQELSKTFSSTLLGVSGTSLQKYILSSDDLL